MLLALVGSVFDARIARDLIAEGFVPQSGARYLRVEVFFLRSKLELVEARNERFLSPAVTTLVPCWLQQVSERVLFLVFERRVAARTCRPTQSNVLADIVQFYCFAPGSTAARGRVHDK